MKAILPLLYLLHFASAQDQLKDTELGQFSDNERQCIHQLQSDQNMITQALKELYMPEENPKFNEFMECTWKKDGFIDENGGIRYERFFYYVQGAYMDAVGIRELAEAFARDTINNCKDVHGNTPGQTGVKLMNCVLRRLYS